MAAAIPASPVHDGRAPGISMGLSLLGLSIAPVLALLGISGSLPMALKLLGIASLAGGLLIFLTHGRAHVTAAGTYCLTAGLMTGSGSWYWASQDSSQVSRMSIFIAALSIYVSTTLMYILFWSSSVPPVAPLDASPRRGISPSLARGTCAVGLILFAVGTAAKVAGASLGTLAQSTAEVGVVLFAASMLLSGNARALISPVRAVALGAALTIFYLLVFNGGGRLRLVTLAITLAVIAQYRLRAPVKSLAVIALIPAMLLFGIIGQSRLAARSGDQSAQAAAAGLGSVVNPLATYAQLIQQNVTGGDGSTLLAEAVVPVPRSMWPGKPVQFGAVMVQKLRPELVNTNLAMPCLAQGEWFYNFSWLGLVLMMLVLGLVIRWLDQLLAKRRRKELGNYRTLFSFVLIAILAGSISDMAWGGTATWEVRNVQRMLVLLPLLALAARFPGGLHGSSHRAALHHKDANRTESMLPSAVDSRR